MQSLCWACVAMWGLLGGRGLNPKPKTPLGLHFPFQRLLWSSESYSRFEGLWNPWMLQFTEGMTWGDSRTRSCRGCAWSAPPFPCMQSSCNAEDYRCLPMPPEARSSCQGEGRRSALPSIEARLRLRVPGASRSWFSRYTTPAGHNELTLSFRKLSRHFHSNAATRVCFSDIVPEKYPRRWWLTCPGLASRWSICRPWELAARARCRAAELWRCWNRNEARCPAFGKGSDVGGSSSCGQ